MFELPTRHSCKTKSFELYTTLFPDKLEILLLTSPSHTHYYRYSSNLTLLDLQESLRQKFESLSNLQMYLVDPHNINVDLKTGIIGLMISISLPNGKAITTRIGEIKLKEDIFDSGKCLDHILFCCQNSDIFNESNFKNIVSEFANMFKVLFKKIELVECSDRPLKSPFPFLRPDLAKSLPEHFYGSSKTIRMHERAKSINLQHKFLKQQLSPIPQTQNPQLSDLRRQLNNRIQNLSSAHKNHIVSLQQQIHSLQKELNIQMQATSKISSEMFKMETDHILLKSLQSNEISNERKSDGTIRIGEEVDELRKQFEEFCQAVVDKIENLGKAAEVIEDKMKRVVEELDLQMERKIISESIHEIDTQIIDKEALFFDQFELKGMEIQYKGEDSISTMLVARTLIHQKNSFSIKIVRTLVNNIQIGIVDSSYRNRRDCWTLPNFILYVGWNSTIYEGPNDLMHKEGNSIVEGDVVTLRANLETGLIEWLVDGQVRAKVVWEKLKDESIEWVPMVRFFDNGDVISWVTEQMLRV